MRESCPANPSSISGMNLYPFIYIIISISIFCCSVRIWNTRYVFLSIVGNLSYLRYEVFLPENVSFGLESKSGFGKIFPDPTWLKSSGIRLDPVPQPGCKHSFSLSFFVNGNLFLRVSTVKP